MNHNPEYPIIAQDKVMQEYNKSKVCKKISLSTCPRQVFAFETSLVSHMHEFKYVRKWC